MTRLFRNALITLLGSIALFSNLYAQDSSGVSTISRFALLGAPIHSILRGNYAYSVYSSGLNIIDIANPTSPQIVGSYPINPTNSYPGDVAVSGSYAYLATMNALQILNISNPSSPQFVSSLRLHGEPDRITIAGNFAYVTTDSGLFVLNITNTTHPQVVDSIIQNTFHTAIVVSDTLLCRLDYWFGLSIFDITNPASPNNIGYCTMQQVRDVAVLGNFAYVVGDSGLRIVDFSNLDSIHIVGSLPNAFLTRDNCISVLGDFAYIGTDRDLKIVNISNPQSPFTADSLETGYESVIDIKISGDNAYIASNFFQVLDITNRTLPQIVGTCYSGSASSVTLFGNYAYSDGLILNVSNPVEPLLATHNNYYFSHQSVINGNFLYTGGYEDSLQIFNISIPTTPQEVGACYMGIQVDDIDFSGNYAYVGTPNGLTVVNILNLTSPQIVATCNNTSDVWGVKVAGEYAILAVDFGLKVVDVSNPALPYIVGSAPSFRGLNIAINGNYAYLGTVNGVLATDLTNPLAPTFTGIDTSVGYVLSLKSHNNYLFLTSFSGLHIYNISNPSNPLNEVGYYRTPGQSQEVAVSGNYAYIADGNNFGIYDCSQALGVLDRTSDAVPEKFTLKQNYPNPFNPTTTIEYTIPSTSKVELKLFDVAGRVVGTLVNFNQNPGTYRVKVDGSKLASGVYFYRLNAGTGSVTKKMMLIR